MSLCCVLHLSGKVVLILLDYTSHVHICSRLGAILEKQSEWPEIRRVLGECSYFQLFLIQDPRETTLNLKPE